MSLRRTPLFERHVALGARLVPFAGWEMPVQYDGIVAEHKATRQAAGLFDVSHMGEFRVTGPGATAFCDRALTCNVATLPPGRCRYGLMCAPDGGILDDLIVSRLTDQELLLVVNAGNIESDFAWLSSLPHDGADLTDESAATALLAVQGPRSADVLAAVLSAEDAARLRALKFYHFASFAIDGQAVSISRTGYTGDLGYEVAAPAEAAAPLWDRLLEAGAPHGLVPVGLGARDTLRLEAGYPLHGHDISPARNPIEADLARFVDLAKGDFVGRGPIAAAAEAGTAQKLAGLVVTGRGIIRDGCPVLHCGNRVGEVTSGSFSPMLERSIGLAYLDHAVAREGTALEVDVRGKPVACAVAARPFYRPR